MKNIVLEDMIKYGIYDRPGPMGKIADEENEDQTTVPDEFPLSPDPQMSNQLSVQRPPIEDEDYIPASTEELSRAAAAIAQLAPTSTIEFFYKKLHNLLDDATDHANKTSSTQDEPDESEERESPRGEEVTVSEAAIRMSIRKFLLENLTDDDLRDYEEFRGAGYSVIEDEPEEISTASDETTKSSGEMSLDDMAKEFGYSGAPGMRQEIERLTDRLTYFATKVKKEDLDALVKYAIGEFTDTMEESDLLDDEDIADMRIAPGFVKGLDSFRYFFVSAFIMPAYKKVVKDATKKLKSEIAQLGIPKELHQTVFNQVTGAAARKPALILKKLNALAASGKIDKKEVQKIASDIESARAVLQASTDHSDDFVQNALDRWQRTGKSERLKVLRQAMDSTYQDL